MRPMKVYNEKNPDQTSRTKSSTLLARQTDHPDIDPDFCRLCWRYTEAANFQPRLYGKKKLGLRPAVPRPTPDAASRAEAKAIFEQITDIEKCARDPYHFSKSSVRYFSVQDIAEIWSGSWDLSNPEFVQVIVELIESYLLDQRWICSAKIVGREAQVPAIPANRTELPHAEKHSIKPSRDYCEEHNPRRSLEARRAYQRDRRYEARFADRFLELVAEWRRDSSSRLTNAVRTEILRCAYLDVMGTTVEKIAYWRSCGVVSQSEIARRIGISRQAVSAALARSGLPH